jgi:hypothetical protein
MSRRIESWAAGLGMVVILAAVPAAIATIQTPAVGKADVCADAGGRHVDVAGCTNVGSDVAVGVAVAGDDEAAAQAAAGQPPCYTPSGVPYYTPGDAPCN